MADADGRSRNGNVGVLSRVRSSALGTAVLFTVLYLVFLAVMGWTGHRVGPGLLVVAVLGGALVASDTAWRRRQDRQAEQDAGGPEVLAAADRAARLGERPADPALAAAARDWLRLRAERRSRSARWAMLACAAGAVAALAVGLVTAQPLGYGVAVVLAFFAVALPLNERSFTRWFTEADAVLGADPA